MPTISAACTILYLQQVARCSSYIYLAAPLRGLLPPTVQAVSDASLQFSSSTTAAEFGASCACAAALLNWELRRYLKVRYVHSYPRGGGVRVPCIPTTSTVHAAPGAGHTRSVP